jgi:DNA-directed RNA polymerase specialized sigma subunit
MSIRQAQEREGDQMTKRELLESYRDIVIEIETLERQSKFLNQFIGGPRPVRAIQLTGMPRGTNDPEAALLQREDTNEVLEKIEAKCAELREMVDAFEMIMDKIEDRRLRIIVRNYYALGWTDERIAEQLELSRQHVNRLRTAYIEQLI